MNKNQMKGTAKDIGGKIQQKVGQAVGSAKHEAEGLQKQAEGKVQKAVGNAQEAVKDSKQSHQGDALIYSGRSAWVRERPARKRGSFPDYREF